MHLSLALLAACGTSPTAAPIPDDAGHGPERAAWTVLVYMAGDNSLEGYVAHDLDELEAGVAAAGTADVRVLVQADRIDGWAEDDGDWTGTRRYAIAADTIPGAVESPHEDIGEVDMGDPRTLEAFLAWGMETAPAEHVMLVLWNHGYAWSMDVAPPPSIAGDDTSGTELSVANGDLVAGLDAHVGAHGPIDVLAFDACYMASWEVAHAVRGHARTLVGSEAWVGGEGLLYVPMLRALAAGDASEQVAAGMAREAVAGGEMTFSAIDLAQLDALAGAVDAFSEIATPTRIAAWQRFGRTVEPGWASAFLDLRALGVLAAQSDTSGAAAAVVETVDAAVISSHGDDAHAWAGGLTIFGATSPPEYVELYANGAGATWARATGWDEALGAAMDDGEAATR